jgi:hypothetical protein
MYVDLQVPLAADALITEAETSAITEAQALARALSSALGLDA